MGIDYVNGLIFQSTSKTIPYIYWYFAAINILAGLYFLLSGMAAMTYCYFDTFDPDFKTFKKENEIEFSCVTTTNPTTFFGNYF